MCYFYLNISIKQSRTVGKKPHLFGQTNQKVLGKLKIISIHYKLLLKTPMCETRSAVSILEKCIRKPSRNPYTSVLLQCLAQDKFLKKHSRGVGTMADPCELKFWKGRVLKVDSDDLTVLQLPNPTNSKGARANLGQLQARFPCWNVATAWGWAVTLHKVPQFLMARSVQGSP